MRRPDWKPLLEDACRHATAFFEGLPERPVAPRQGAAAMLAALDRPLPEAPGDPRAVLDELVRTCDPGITGSQSGRFFGWVLGGGLPSAVAADWLTSTWDQNVTSGNGTPAAAAIEQVTTRWVAELLDVPAASGALVTGGQMANFVGLAIARNEVLRRAGWDFDAEGLLGAPPITVIAGAERHATVDRALRMLGLGTRQLRLVETDREGQLRGDAFAEALRGDGPAIVCAQAGNVNGGGFDPLAEIAEHVARARAHRPIWYHLDGAFGLWARATPARRALAAGAEAADSWSTDAHKWLNTPFDCGIVLSRDADAHRRAFNGAAPYLPPASAVRNPFDHTPELSRRARGFALWAALRELGRTGVADLVERCCTHATSFARGLAAVPGIEVMNDVRLNQLVVRFHDPRAAAGDPAAHDAHTHAVIRRTLDSGVCYPTPTVWRGIAAMRISISNWSTDDADITASVAAIARAHTT
ncbi:MAG TPA: pyridoxal-dependent decarboxylase [Kofleriaceae bacterium]|nr:pyridoxal-dependent decarboxylase [Kofleriaceae bacterium]